MSRLQHHLKLSAGFTLIETMVVIGLLSILTALAAPSLQDAMDRYRATAVYDELRSTFVFARSEAIRTRSRVIVQRTVNANCATVQEWQCGWFVYVDANGDGVQQPNPAAPAIAEPALRTVDPLSGGTVVGMFKGNQSQVTFDRWGNITPLGIFRQVIVPRGTINSPGVKTLCASSGGRFRSVDGDVSDVACSTQ
jgi:type IV fimbrial biogenesis protein FimT